MPAVRMRYPYQVVEELREIDPNTPVTVHYVRSLIADGTIPVVKVGRRQLVNFDAFLVFLENGQPSQTPPQSGTIRQIIE